MELKGGEVSSRTSRPDASLTTSLRRVWTFSSHPTCTILKLRTVSLIWSAEKSSRVELEVLELKKQQPSSRAFEPSPGYKKASFPGASWKK